MCNGHQDIMTIDSSHLFREVNARVCMRNDWRRKAYGIV